MGLKESGLRGSLRNVSVGIDAIPDSGNLYADYDPAQLDISDGDDVTTWECQINSDNDLQADTGNPTYREDEINGHPVLDFDGDRMVVSEEDFGTINQPFTIYSVVKHESSGRGGVWDKADRTTDDSSFFRFEGVNDTYDISFSNFTTGGTYDGEFAIVGIRADGSNSRLIDRDDEKIADDVGGQELVGHSVGEREDSEEYLDGPFARHLVYDSGHDNETMSDVMSFLADEYAISLE